jgi:cytochrome P450/NADPH-cytochrome P450 reductase
LVLFGSNMGTAEELANQLAATGEANGYRPTVASLDEYVEKLPSTGAVIIVTSSYNGKPPDNAVKFYQWLTTAQPDATTCGTLKYAVFGCGNRDWATTFQAVPRIIDERLAALGAQRLVPHGEGDARDDFFGDFQRWSTPLWGDFAKAFGLDANTTVTQSARGPLYAVELVNEKLPNPFIAAFNACSMVVIENRELQTHDGPTPSDRSTRHIEIALPEGVRYQTGDHLGVITRNPRDLVARIARRFQYAESTILRIKQQGIGKSNLPLDKAISVYDLLTDYVELQEVATQAQIQLLAEHTPCPPEAMKLRAWAGEDEASRARYRSDILAQRRSVLDLLEEFMACELPFHLYLEMLPALRPRYYSISSSPRAQERICSITVAVVDGPARSGRGHYHGVCSTYLAASKKGHSIYAFVRDPQSAFQLPRNPQTPLIMVGPGTGFAPFRGFLQERAALQSAGETLGRALLFYGCRHCDQDYIYRQEVEAYAAQGVVELHTAFSRLDPDRKVYVQDRIIEQKAAVWELVEAGATFFVCGDAAKMEPDVRAALKRIHQEQRGGDEAAAQSWLEKLIADQRYVVDVWAAT